MSDPSQVSAARKPGRTVPAGVHPMSAAVGGRGNYLHDLHAEVSRLGVKVVADAGFMAPATVKRFLRDPMSVRISTLSKLSRACTMPIGQFHLVDRTTGVCITCDAPGAEHYPLLPEIEEAKR